MKIGTWDLKKSYSRCWLRTHITSQHWVRSQWRILLLIKNKGNLSKNLPMRVYQAESNKGHVDLAYRNSCHNAKSSSKPEKNCRNKHEKSQFGMQFSNGIMLKAQAMRQLQIFLQETKSSGCWLLADPAAAQPQRLSMPFHHVHFERSLWSFMWNFQVATLW